MATRPSRTAIACQRRTADLTQATAHWHRYNFLLDTQVPTYEAAGAITLTHRVCLVRISSRQCLDWLEEESHTPTNV